MFAALHRDKILNTAKIDISCKLAKDLFVKNISLHLNIKNYLL